MDWIMYTVGVVSHIWAALTLVGLYMLYDDYRVKYHGGEVTIYGKFFIPWIGVLAFWMWVFFG